MSSDSTPYAVNAVLTVKPERRDEFVKVIKEDQAQTLATEAGSVRFVVGQDVDNSNKFYLHEQYVHKQAYEDHTKTPHFAPFDEFCKSEPWAGDGGAPQALFYNVAVAENPDDIHKNQKQQPPPPIGHYCLHASLTLKPERREEFVNIFLLDQKKTLADEPDSVHFEFGASQESENTFVVFEQYKSKQAFEQHNQMPHYQPWAAFCETDPWAPGGEPQVAFYDTI